jgi:hypothetical protein
MSPGHFAPTPSDVEASLRRTLAFARAQDYVGYGKHDALNSPLVKSLTLDRASLRVLAIQLVMRSPVNLRPMLGVKKYRNPKGIALFVRSYLNLYRWGRRPEDLQEASNLLAWLEEIRIRGWSGPCWGYFWDWQDLDLFYAPFGSPNTVVTTFVAQALVDGFEATGNRRWLRLAEDSLQFIRRDLSVLYEDDSMKCVSYVPGQKGGTAVLNVNALVGALMTRVGCHVGDASLLVEARKLLNYAVDKQTAEGAWYYTHPPEASPVKIDNYHTAFMLESLLDYQLATGDDGFLPAYLRGMAFFRANLFREDGAPKWTSEQVYPLDIHGAGTAIAAYSRAARSHDAAYLEDARRTTSWALRNMQSSQGFFYYKKHKWWTNRFTEMRWCNAWMSYGLSTLLLTESTLDDGPGGEYLGN